MSPWARLCCLCGCRFALPPLYPSGSVCLTPSPFLLSTCDDSHGQGWCSGRWVSRPTCSRFFSAFHAPPVGWLTGCVKTGRVQRVHLCGLCVCVRLCAGCVGCVDCVRCVRLCACVKVRVFVWVVRVVCLFVLSNCPAFGCMVGRELLLQP